ncbi:MAG: FtsW/RodA/SpoVE family cell cycle protein [Prevotella sp.]|nr:FtsW/RodA/SpoVE family cell cycle protein [Prevotella sp.]MCM1075049.1 FtsW/RodA/SpoVE family cell cycle protein [Ruminococcus sp.]
MSPRKKKKNDYDVTGISVEYTYDDHLQSEEAAEYPPKTKGKTGKPKAAEDVHESLRRARAKLKGLEERSRVRLRADRYLWGIYLMLLLFSVVELYSASSSEVRATKIYGPLLDHGMFLLIGLGLVLLMQNIHYKYYKKLAWFGTIVSIGLVFYANHHGVVANGAMRAIHVAGFTIQPPEIAKLALVLILARIISNNQMLHGVTNKGIIWSLIILGVFTALLYTNGLTNTVIIFAVAVAMFIIGGTQIRKLLIIGVLFGAVGFMVYSSKFSDNSDEGTATEMSTQVSADGINRDIDRSDLRKDRITSFLEGVTPQDTLTDYNRQVIFANMSQAHGGILGNGPGNSSGSARLPLAYSDYIFSIIVEDTGFVGGIFLLILYLLLLARAGVIAAKCTKAFPALLITGCATLIVVQAMIHMCIVVGLAPVSGQPLPFISKGGTSIVVMSAAMGMMLSVSKYAIQRSSKNQDANLALKQAVEDSGDTGVNPSMIPSTETSPQKNKQ